MTFYEGVDTRSVTTTASHYIPALVLDNEQTRRLPVNQFYVFAASSELSVKLSKGEKPQQNKLWANLKRRGYTALDRIHDIADDMINNGSTSHYLVVPHGSTYELTEREKSLLDQWEVIGMPDLVTRVNTIEFQCQLIHWAATRPLSNLYLPMAHADLHRLIHKYAQEDLAEVYSKAAQLFGGTDDHIAFIAAREITPEEPEESSSNDASEVCSELELSGNWRDNSVEARWPSSPSRSSDYDRGSVSAIAAFEPATPPARVLPQEAPQPAQSTPNPARPPNLRPLEILARAAAGIQAHKRAQRLLAAAYRHRRVHKAKYIRKAFRRGKKTVVYAGRVYKATKPRLGPCVAI
ncbi:uncharacterized protein I303_103373 [Kwoniella dejecticola CBS 10117]|uniref:Uncharacterized protein n=1 Tax=Kwoniella dejecticola CBS 10117 TaxID=1296121 RepID=A0A1A6A6K7_9TREE|nr:uncharacterized protein I303_03396 [Kwoniella dejecticola CBS 10117]OBR85685.1 hypothetical protein I303_03396 [Kwoniella dejecticola CBS 10117]